MPLVDSLLTAIIRADGDALVLHAGECPYVVAPTGQSPLASRVLTLEAMTGMLGELLPHDARGALDEFGAVQHELASPAFAAPGERFSVVAARGGEDIWIEIRRHRTTVEVEPPMAVAPPVFEAEPEPEPEPEPIILMSEPEPEPEHLPVFEQIEDVEQETYQIREAEEPEVHEISLDAGFAEPAPGQDPAYGLDAGFAEPAPGQDPAYGPRAGPVDPPIEGRRAGPVDPPIEGRRAGPVDPPIEVRRAGPVDPPIEGRRAGPVAPPIEGRRAGPVDPPIEVRRAGPVAPPIEGRRAGPVDPPIEVRRAGPVDPPIEARPVSLDLDPGLASDSRGANVLPLSRNQVRSEQAMRFSPPLHTAGIDRLLRIAAARGASTLYLTSQARPSIRVDGEISAIDGEGVLSEPDVEALMLDIIPERNRETLRSQAGTEWICDVPDVGRIRCVTFRDHRGAGGIFRMIPARAISAEQLGLSREIQGLCAEAEGLVLVTGPRSSGKSTLISAFVDLINRTRSDHVITLENQIKFVHENRGSLVSQREVRGDRSEWLQVARAALRENPDVLVIEDFGSPEIVTLALEAAQSGHLIIGALTAHTAMDAVDRIIDQTPPDRRPKVQLGLAESLRGIVAQVLLRKTSGGRVAGREVLLNTSAVANLIAEGKTSQLPMAIDSGRKHGMVALNDALVAFVQGGSVDSREAYRQAADQQGFLALLKRQGIDTTFVERLA